MSAAAPMTEASLQPRAPEDSPSPSQAAAGQSGLATAGLDAGVCAAALDGMAQGLAVYDAEDRLLACNGRYFELYPALRGCLRAGVSYETVQHAELEQEAEDEARQGPALDERLRERLGRHSRGGEPFERRLADGRRLRIAELRGPDGGTLAFHSDVTEQRACEAALQRSRAEMQEFANVASHDLQEPLRKIEAFAARLQAKLGDDISDDAKQYLERMLNANGRMRGLLGDLLIYSRVTTRAKPFAPVELTALVTGVVEGQREAIEKAGFTVDVADLPEIEADARQMQLLFHNLIDNAVKFRRECVTPELRIYAESIDDATPAADERRYRIVVADNGIGFEMEQRERIFAIFQRLHGRNQYEGTGVGLATCRKIVERHRGTITAESEPGQGSRFIVTLPAHPAPQESKP